MGSVELSACTSQAQLHIAQQGIKWERIQQWIKWKRIQQWIKWERIQQWIKWERIQHWIKWERIQQRIKWKWVQQWIKWERIQQWKEIAKLIVEVRAELGRVLYDIDSYPGPVRYSLQYPTSESLLLLIDENKFS